MSRRIADKTTIALEEMLMEHPEFKKLADNDATVYAWLKTAATHENREFVGSPESILIGIIVALGRDKQAYFDQNLKQAQLCTCRKMVVDSTKQMKDDVRHA